MKLSSAWSLVTITILSEGREATAFFPASRSNGISTPSSASSSSSTSRNSLTRPKLFKEAICDIVDKAVAAKKARKEAVRSKIDEFRVKTLLSTMDLAPESRTMMEDVDDTFTTITTKLLPPNMIAQNEDALSNEDIRLFDPPVNGEVELETPKFSLGWNKAGDGYDDWEKDFFTPEMTYELYDGITIRRIQEDPFTGEPPKAFKLMFDVFKSSTIHPLDDSIVDFPSPEQAKQLIHDLQLQSSAEEGASPAPYNDWGDDPSTNEYFERFFFHGLGATLLEQQKEEESSHPELGPIEIDLDFMAGLEVRDSFRMYGCKIYFDANQKVKGIYDSEKKKLIFPDDGEKWESAKFLAKSCTLLLCTAREHLIQSHLLCSNYLALSSIKHLPPSHPIRRLTNIFTFRANDVNGAAAISLLPRNSLLHRCCGLTYESIRKVFGASVTGSNAFQPFPKRPLRKELLELSEQGLFPYHKEGVEYYNILEKMVRAWLKEGGEASYDEHAKAFYNEIQKSTVNQAYTLPEFGEEAMVDLLTQCFFRVTAYHEIIGTVIDYTEDPYSMSVRVASQEGADGKGTASADVQSFLIMLLMTASTALKVPKLMKPFENYFAKDGAPEWERAKWDSFVKQLEEQSATVAQREAERDFEFKFFDPANFETSISV